MTENINEKDIEEIYKKLGIITQHDNLDEYPFFRYSEKDEHLAWKPMRI